MVGGCVDHRDGGHLLEIGIATDFLRLCWSASQWVALVTHGLKNTTLFWPGIILGKVCLIGLV